MQHLRFVMLSSLFFVVVISFQSLSKHICTLIFISSFPCNRSRFLINVLLLLLFCVVFLLCDTEIYVFNGFPFCIVITNSPLSSPAPIFSFWLFGVFSETKFLSFCFSSNLITSASILSRHHLSISCFSLHLQFQIWGWTNSCIFWILHIKCFVIHIDSQKKLWKAKQVLQDCNERTNLRNPNWCMQIGSYKEIIWFVVSNLHVPQ